MEERVAAADQTGEGHDVGGGFEHGGETKTAVYINIRRVVRERAGGRGKEDAAAPCLSTLPIASTVTASLSLWFDVDNSSELAMWKEHAAWRAFDHQFPGC